MSDLNKALNRLAVVIMLWAVLAGIWLLEFGFNVLDLSRKPTLEEAAGGIDFGFAFKAIVAYGLLIVVFRLMGRSSKREEAARANSAGRSARDEMGSFMANLGACIFMFGGFLGHSGPHAIAGLALLVVALGLMARPSK